MIALHDHEEAGSRSASGAQSRLLLGVLERLVTSYGESSGQAAARAFARSLLVSCDMAHAIHPNYADKHDQQHTVKLGQGPVIKFHANQAYATDGPAAAVFDETCREAGGAAQRFVSRSDLPCGSTIGPVSAARTSIRTVDVGSPMLSMHSCRETVGTADIDRMIRALTGLLSHERLPAPSS